MEASARICPTISFICTGPSPQLIPRASTPRPSSRATAEAALPPVRSFPFSSKVMVTNTGRWECSLAPSTAAFTS